MQRLVLLAVLVALVGQIDCSLKCYECDSKVSFDDCDKQRKDIACDVQTHRCIKVDVKYTYHSQDIHLFKKTCVKKETCVKSKNAICKSVPMDTDSDCNPLCCSSDLCNGAITPLVSGILIVTCVVGILVANTFRML